MTFFEFIYKFVGLVILAIWIVVPPFAFHDAMHDIKQRKQWKNLSRRQKIFLSVFLGPLVLINTLFCIFVEFTGPFFVAAFNFVVKLVAKYFNLLK
jgi:hypothetical protein